jgi:hypothetical protein
MAWITLGQPNVLTSTSDDLDITNFTSRKFNFFLNFIIPSGTVSSNITFDDNNNSDYARRQDFNYGTDTTNASQSNIQMSNSVTVPQCTVIFGININSEEKLFIIQQTRQNTAGAANATESYDMVAKIDTTTNSGQYSRIDINNDQSGDFDIDSSIVIHGTD